MIKSKLLRCGVFILVCALPACTAIKSADQSTLRIKKLTNEQIARQKAALEGKVHKVERPYFGEAVIAEVGIQSGKKLPQRAESARGFKLTGQNLKIEEIAKAISDQTDIITRIKTNYIAPDGTSLKIPIGGSVKLTHEGSLSSALDKIGTILDVAWEYDGMAITFNRMVSRDYLISLPTGQTSISTSFNGVQNSGRSVSMSRNVENYSIWDDIENMLSQAIPTPAHFKMSKQTGRITVFGPPSVQRVAMQIVEKVEKTISSRIGIEVGVYFVNTELSDDFSTALNAQKTNGSNTASLIGNVLSGSGIATLSRGVNQISFKALAENASVVDYRSGTTVAQSGVISPIILTRLQNYISNSTVTTTDGVTTTSIETASVDTGISIHALPRLIGNKKIQLFLTILQNDLAKLDTFTSGTSTVQLPTIDQRAIQNDTVLAPGETLIFSGYEQETANRSNSGVGDANFFGLGGTAKAKNIKIKMVVMVRPTIIPWGT